MVVKDLFSSQPQYGAPPPEHRPEGPPPLSEAEFEEIMGRNRTVSSSAIARAVSDAAAGNCTYISM
jgi:cleavage and polyadenylation specificity factor subunit 6/7